MKKKIQNLLSTELDPIEPLLYTDNFSEWKTRVYCLIFSELIYVHFNKSELKCVLMGGD